MSHAITPADTLHTRLLLQRRRCPHCAETVSSAVVLRGGTCGRCQREVHSVAGVDVEDVIEAIRKDWRRWRWPVYLLVFIAQAATSWIPVAPAILMFVSLIAVELLMIRRPLRWLSVRRRIVSRASLRLSAAVITIIDLLLNLVLLPLIGVNVLTIGVVGTLLVVGYVEVSLAVASNRLRREARAPGLDWWEWSVPAFLILLVFGASFGILGSASLFLYVLSMLQVPGVSDIANFLLSSGA